MPPENTETTETTTATDTNADRDDSVADKEKEARHDDLLPPPPVFSCVRVNEKTWLNPTLVSHFVKRGEDAWSVIASNGEIIEVTKPYQAAVISLFGLY